ncbi:putative oxaloacetate(2-) transmembrane transport protein, partial [Trypoxylus dichotomus]
MPLSFLPVPDETRLPRWYFGGVAATLAQVCIYPVDVVKIGLQTEQIMEKITTYRYARYLLQTQGLPGSLRQQFLHSTSRFGIYHKIKEELQMKEVPFVVDLMLSAASGAVGALLKNPVEIINTRML